MEEEKHEELHIPIEELQAQPLPLKISLSIIGVVVGLLVLFIYNFHPESQMDTLTSKQNIAPMQLSQSQQQPATVAGASTEVMGPPDTAETKKASSSKPTPSEKPTSTPTSAPSATPTSTPSPTPQPTNTPTPTATPTPTMTPSPTPSPTPELTISPTP